MPSYTQGTVVPAHEPGEYEFSVKSAVNKKTKKTPIRDMIELKIDAEGVTVFDYLIFDDKSAWKIDQFRAATGDDVEAGAETEFDASDCNGREGRVVLTVETYEGKKRNKVVEYVVSGEKF